MYSSFDYSGNITGARQNFNTAVKTRGSLTDEEAINAYQNANEALFRVQSKMYQTVKDMRALGMDDADIRKSLKKYKIGNVRELMNGEFVPMTISRETRREVRENGNDLPISALNDIRFDLKGTPLGSLEEPDETRSSDLSAAPTGGGLFSGIQLTPQQQLMQQNTGAPSPSSVAPPATTAAPVPTTTSPQTRQALAGLNPGTQLIATRTGP
jgi:hypothetical protein